MNCDVVSILSITTIPNNSENLHLHVTLTSNHNFNKWDTMKEQNNRNDDIFAFDETQTEFNLYSNEENTSKEEDTVKPSLDHDASHGCNVNHTIVQNFHGGSPELDCLVELYIMLDKRGVANTEFDDVTKWA